MASAMMIAVLASSVLLPAISASDDLLEQRQAALPASSQTWKVATDGISGGFGTLPTGDLLLKLPTSFPSTDVPRSTVPTLSTTLAKRLVRDQRLRPPLASA